jgi:uncharacterized membrane protein YedE/YeeE
MKDAVALFAGLLFGVGLALSGMTDTAKVQGFLDLFGAWIPDLLFVMGGAVAVTLVLFRFVLKRSKPLLAESFELPSNTAINAPVLIGSALFGIGWGLYGYCPGPAVSALAYLDWQTVLFVGAMLLGMAIQSRVKLPG